MIHCINCGHVNAEGASQCEACFETLPAVTSCPTCQATVPEDAYFCPQCGASLPRGVTHPPHPPGQSDDEVASSPPGLPPTHVVAQPSLGSAPLPPTDVVHPMASSGLPPTNVVHPSAAETFPPASPAAADPVDLDSDVPPTYLVNALPETLPPQPPTVPLANSPSDIPPTNVVHRMPEDTPRVESSVASQEDEAQEPESQIETVPTMVVSPDSDRNVVDTTLPPSQPTTPPTAPPIAPPPVPAAAVDNVVVPTPEAIEELPSPAPAEMTPLPTTVQPSMPIVGETVIQRPAAHLLHERTNTKITLPSNLEIILVGKMTSSVTPDVDVSGFVDSDVVSRRHAAIFVMPDGYFVEDLGSSNGTYVNDEPCSQGDRLPIKAGDRICLGRENKVSFIFQIG